MEEKRWKLKELPIGAEILVWDFSWEYVVATLKEKYNWWWRRLTEDWEYYIIPWDYEYVQDEQNRFTFYNKDDWDKEEG